MHKFIKIVVSALSAAVVGLSALPIVSAAETGQNVLDDTRYSAVGFESIADIVGILQALTDEATSPTEAETIRDSLLEFAKKAAEKYINDTIDDANKTWETAPNYTVQSTFCIMGKRKIMYPNGENEVQTVICYINKNVDDAFPQQFGQYTIAPNTIFFVRNTSWDGVIPISIPIAENNIQYFTYNADYAFEIWLNVPPDDTFVYDTPNGRETYGLRHTGAKIHFINNTVNSIVRNDFVEAYEDSQVYYSTFLPNIYADNIPAFMGNGYVYERSSPFMLDNCMPFYVTTAFFNGDSDFGNRIYNYFNTDPDNIDPSKPPAYVIPNDNPLSDGQTINNNTINNYNDYGITDIDGQLSIDPNILAGALGGLIDPDFTGALGGVFEAQPQIGLGFDTPLELNLPDLVGDFINSITVQPSWDAPQYPAVNTSAFIPATYPTYSTVTIPQDLAQNMGKILTSGWDIFDSLGVLSFAVPIIIMLLLWRFTGK